MSTNALVNLQISINEGLKTHFSSSRRRMRFIGGSKFEKMRVASCKAGTTQFFIIGFFEKPNHQRFNFLGFNLVLFKGFFLH